MSCPVPWAADAAPACARCGGSVPAAVNVCARCVRVLEQLHLPALRRDLARLELHLRFEAEYPAEREAGSTDAAGGPRLPAA